MFSFAVPRFFSKSLEKEKGKEQERIRYLKQQLVEIGYNAAEVDYMISILSENKKLADMDSISIKKIEDALEEQLCVARRSIEIVKMLRVDVKRNRS